MTLRVFIPRDAGAVAVGADEVALAFERAAATRGVTLEIVRTGSRGLYWLEPMVEVATAQGRVAFGPLSPPCSTRCSRTALTPCGSASPTKFPG
jgi:formate dehydrogenase iron-sulfur subunit